MFKKIAVEHYFQVRVPDSDDTTAIQNMALDLEQPMTMLSKNIVERFWHHLRYHRQKGLVIFLSGRLRFSNNFVKISPYGSFSFGWIDGNIEIEVHALSVFTTRPAVASDS